jgi:hypothetical protein
MRRSLRYRRRIQTIIVVGNDSVVNALRKLIHREVTDALGSP